MLKYFNKRVYSNHPIRLFFLAIVFSLICVSTALADVEINVDNFPDAKFRQYIIDARFDKDGNGSLSDKEIGKVKKIDCSFKSISSLEGIECFNALATLWCDSNQLTSLDVSKNTALQSLNCSSNQLTSLDVTQNAAMTGLACDSNQLTSLDVSQNTALTNMECYSKKNTIPSPFDLSSLTGFDFNRASNWNGCIIDGNTLIATSSSVRYDYDCGNNWKVQFSFSIDPEVGIAIDENIFPDNNFREYIGADIDYDKNGILTDPERYSIQYMWCGDKSIVDFTGLEYFVALNRMDCGYNYLTNLDVSKNKALEELYCGYNYLTDLDVSQNTALTGLWCQSNQLTSLDVSKNTALTSLNCASNQLTSLDVSHNTALRYLYCGFNQLTSLDVSKNSVLNGLICYSNQLAILSPFDLSLLPDSFDLSKASNWKGGSVDAMVLTATADRVTYDYDCGYRNPMQVTLKVVKPTFILPSSTITIEEQAFEGIKDQVFQIPATVTSIADDAFDSTAIVVVEAGSYAEKRCRELRLKVYVKK